MKKLDCQICEPLPWTPHAKKRCIHNGFNLDIGGSDHPQPGYLSLDIRDLSNVSFVWDIERLPLPFPSDCVDQLLACHILEHVSPKITIDLWNELWRICKQNSQMFVIVPTGGSVGFWQDPSHISGYIPETFAYFTPEHPSNLWEIYRPKPWRMLKLNSSPLHNTEAILMPLKEGKLVKKRVRKPKL